MLTGAPRCSRSPEPARVVGVASNSKLNLFCFGKWTEILEAGRFPKRTVDDIAATALELFRFCAQYSLTDDDDAYAGLRKAGVLTSPINVCLRGPLTHTPISFVFFLRTG